MPTYTPTRSHCAPFGPLPGRSRSRALVRGALCAALVALAALCMALPRAARADDAVKTITYVVKPGDTVQSVSQALLDEPAQFLEVARFNRLRNPNLIYPGQQLRVPVVLLRGNAVPLTLAAVNGPVQVDGQPATTGMAVPEGARVSTGAGASAVLVRGDGTRMQLLPDSLAEVKKNRAIEQQQGLFRSVLALVSGAVDMAVEKLALKDHVKVITPTSTIGVRGTQYRVGAAQAVSRVEVLQGRVATASPAAHAELALDGGFGTVVPQGRPPAGAIALLSAPVLPADELTVHRNGAAFDFAAVKGAQRYRYLVSPAEQADVVLATGLVPQPPLALPTLADGRYVVRVRALDANGLEGFDGRRGVTVKILTAPFDLGMQPRADGLRLYWEGTQGSARYHVQVARDADFRLLVTEATVTEPQALLRDLPAGRYYWRVGQEPATGAPGAWAYSRTDTLVQP